VRQMYVAQKFQAQERASGNLLTGLGFDGQMPSRSFSAFNPSSPFSPFAPSGLGGTAQTDGAVRADMPGAGDPARYDKIRALLLSKGVDKRVIDAAIAEGLKRNVDPMLVLSVIDQESNFKRTAYNRGSGCTGLMQLDPATAADMGVHGNLYDINANIKAGVKYIDWIANKFFKMNQDLSNMAKIPADKLKMILASYNWGIGNVQKTVRKHGVAALDRVAPKETRNYIAEIPGRIRGWFASLY
jgi:soluble lytic murein transglycosylase-like protein